MADRRLGGGSDSLAVRLPPVGSGSARAWDEADAVHVLAVVSMLMATRKEETSLLRVVAAAVHALGPWKLEGIHLSAGGWGDASALTADAMSAALVEVQLRNMDTDEGELTISGRCWARCVALSSPWDRSGFIVVSADGPPPNKSLDVLRLLGRYAGMALATSRLHALEGHEQAMVSEVAVLNAELGRVVDDLRWQATVRDRLDDVTLSGQGQRGIACCAVGADRAPGRGGGSSRQPTRMGRSRASRPFRWGRSWAPTNDP